MDRDLAWDTGFKFIFLETDSTTILNWLTNDSVLPPDVVPLIFDCWNLMARAWTIYLFHIYRETNRCMDALAKRGRQQQSILEVYDLCPNFVYPTFVWDMKQLGTSRMCPLEAYKLVVV